MISIYHGDNFVASREALHQIKNALKLNAKKITQADLAQAVASNALFQNHQPIIIENLLTLPRSANKQTLIDLVLSSENKNIYLWEPKTITPSVKKQFSKAKIQEFKLKKVLFNFLDSLKPNNSKTSLSLFHQYIQTEAPELLFYMFHRRTAQLIQAKDAPETLKSAPWQIANLKSQAKNFSLNQLIKLHQKLLNIDYAIKSGQTDLDLTVQLDLLLISI